MFVIRSFSSVLISTYFCPGFHYNPVGFPAVAWSVYNIQTQGALDGHLNPLPFEFAQVNTGEVYDFRDHHVHISIGGYYFVQFNIGAVSYQPVDVVLLRGRTGLVAGIWRSSTSHNLYDTLGRGIILELFAGETLNLAVAEGTVVYSNPGIQTSFTGFLIQPSL